MAIDGSEVKGGKFSLMVGFFRVYFGCVSIFM